MTTVTETVDRESLAAQLAQSGYCIIRQAVPGQLLTTAEQEFDKLTRRANAILATIDRSGMSPGDYYGSGADRFIVVPEASNPAQTCRFEYIQGSSDIFRNEVIPFCRDWIEQLSGHPVTLFKDKCNLKGPGGGAFTAHQDIEAYLPFGPSFHVTAALLLDPATEKNGALEFADNFVNVQHAQLRYLSTPNGRLPLLPTGQGGEQHGSVLAELEQQLQWQPVYTTPGDLLLFNSFVPHRSAVNMSTSTRRAFFFTFNLQRDGEHYEEYYRQKRADYGNPHFHVATPTRRNL